jgi:tetratricopeptide (TPR) repeat protein
LEGFVASVEPIVVVLGPRCGGTSAVAGILHHLGVFMGTEFSLAYRELNQSWEESALYQLCVRAFSEPGDQLQMDPGLLRSKLSSWADDHRRAATAAGQPSGAKHPCLCLAVDAIREAWGPIVPVVVNRPVDKVVASLNRLGWLPNEQERAASTARLIAARDHALAGVPTVRVDFEELRAAPADVIRRLAEQLGLEVTETQLQAAVDSVVNTPDMPQDVDPHQRLIDQLLPELDRNPADVRSVSLLAQVYFDAGDFANARRWFARKIELGGPDEEIYLAMFRAAQSLEELGTSWHVVQDAYLQAWEFRPTRAEPLFCIARHYFNQQRYRLGHLYATFAAGIPLPADDMSVPYPDVYAWRAVDLQARCGFCVGEHREAFELWRRLLARPDIPDAERQRIAASRDHAVPAMLEAASQYPNVPALNVIAESSDPDITVSLVAGPDVSATEKTLNSFLQCCTDVSGVGRFLILDDGLSTQDRAQLQARYPFLEFVDRAPGAQLERLRDHISGRYWLHLGQGWEFFAPEKLITRLVAVLEAEKQVFQVGINLADAAGLTGTSALETTVRRAPDAGRYLLVDAVARGPAMFDTRRLDDAAGLQTATLDEVLCIIAQPNSLQ